jgi:flavin reductase (DIM6/NTAB) family NADH-FMN oxidoreductase RutF
VSPEEFRDVFAGLTAAVCLLATTDVVGRDCALTVTSVAGVSLVPPLALVAVKRDGFLHDAISVADGWAVTMLAEEQLALARYAARHRYPSDTDDFRTEPSVRGAESGALLFTGGVAGFECRTEELVPAGDHTLVLGRLVATAVGMTGTVPLLYGRRTWWSAPRPLA